MATMAKTPTSVTSAVPTPGLRTARPYLVKGRPEVSQPQRSLLGSDVLEALLAIEGEDGHITGITRSLSRRLLALNVHGRLEPQAEFRAVPAAALGHGAGTRIA